MNNIVCKKCGHIAGYDPYYSGWVCTNSNCGYIEKENTIEMRPLNHGYWIPKPIIDHSGEWYCSICGKDMLYTWGPGCGLADYCPHCGAKMDGDRE